MFDVESGNKIVVHRQDPGTFTVTYSGDEIDESTTKTLFTVRKQPEFNSVRIIEKTLPISEGKTTITVTSDDTNHEPGDYFWDVRLVFVDGEPFTPMDPARFKIKKVVGQVNL